MSKVDKDNQYCVKVQLWKKGFLKKTLNKDFFIKLDDAERYYNGCEKEGTKVQLSKFNNGHEKVVKEKNN